jgi:TfoX/Sxy family transcriptional regulator of competence genes
LLLQIGSRILEPMAKPFLDQLGRMIHRATSGRIGDVKVECRHFFSGAAVYANGRICASLTPAGFAIKLPKESRDVLFKRRGVKPLRYFAKGPVKKEYLVLPKELIRNRNRLQGLLEISVAYVLRSSLESKRRVPSVNG